MARPIKTGLDYFPLDCHMSEEVNLIMADYGIEGFGVLVSMFQQIYGDKGYYIEWSARQQKLFSRKVGLEQEKVNAIINECIEWDIFNKDQFNKSGILTSRRIQEHYSTSTYKRVGVVMEKDYLMIDVSSKIHVNKSNIIVTDDGNVDTTKVTDDKSTQSTVQYSTENKSNKYKEVYDYYLTLDLIKHKKYTKEMTIAMKHAETNLSIDTDEMKVMLKRHEQKVIATKNNGKYKTVIRGLAVFFGQKKSKSIVLICSDYLNENYQNEVIIKKVKINRDNIKEVKLCDM